MPSTAFEEYRLTRDAAQRMGLDEFQYKGNTYKYGTFANGLGRYKRTSAKKKKRKSRKSPR